MTSLTFELIHALEGRTLSTAESCTGGMIGAALTAVPGSSRVFKGGVISYTNEIKERLLGVPSELLTQLGPVSAAVAEAMAVGVRQITASNFAVSVTGLAGPGGDEFGNPVGTVFIGFADCCGVCSNKFFFTGDRDEIRNKAADAALRFVLERI